MQTVMTTSGGYDTILLVDDQGKVLSAWVATPETVSEYMHSGSNARLWEIGVFDGFDGECEGIEDYGIECGRNGMIFDLSREVFWTR